MTAISEQLVDTNFTDPNRIASKWGDAIALGFLAVPDALLINQSVLGMTTTESMVLLNVLSYWWFEERKPFPRTSVIAKRMGVANRTVQRALEQLQLKGILEKGENSRGATTFDPTPLVAKVQKLTRRDPRFATRGNP
jgi:hypothetical protein